MQKYKEFQPTSFDRKGAFLDDERSEWFVVPVSQTRDSRCLSRSNFDVSIDMLGSEENEDIEVHRFGHWGPGWFEIIIVKPDTDTFKIAEDIESSLDDYPVLNEEHFSDLEWNEASGYWENMDIKERIYYCDRHDVSIFSARSDCIPEDIYASDLLE